MKITDKKTGKTYMISDKDKWSCDYYGDYEDLEDLEDFYDYEDLDNQAEMLILEQLQNLIDKKNEDGIFSLVGRLIDTINSVNNEKEYYAKKCRKTINIINDNNNKIEELENILKQLGYKDYKNKGNRRKVKCINNILKGGENE